MTDLNGRPGRGPAGTKRTRDEQYWRGHLIRPTATGTKEEPRYRFAQDDSASAGLKAEYKVGIKVKIFEF